MPILLSHYICMYNARSKLLITNIYNVHLSEVKKSQRLQDHEAVLDVVS